MISRPPVVPGAPPEVVFTPPVVDRGLTYGVLICASIAGLIAVPIFRLTPLLGVELQYISLTFLHAYLIFASVKVYSGQRLKGKHALYILFGPQYVCLLVLILATSTGPIIFLPLGIILLGVVVHVAMKNTLQLWVETANNPLSPRERKEYLSLPNAVWSGRFPDFTQSHFRGDERFTLKKYPWRLLIALLYFFLFSFSATLPWVIDLSEKFKNGPKGTAEAFFSALIIFLAFTLLVPFHIHSKRTLPWKKTISVLVDLIVRDEKFEKTGQFFIKRSPVEAILLAVSETFSSERERENVFQSPCLNQGARMSLVAVTVFFLSAGLIHVSDFMPLFQPMILDQPMSQELPRIVNLLSKPEKETLPPIEIRQPSNVFGTETEVIPPKKPKPPKIKFRTPPNHTWSFASLEHAFKYKNLSGLFLFLSSLVLSLILGPLAFILLFHYVAGPLLLHFHQHLDPL